MDHVCESMPESKALRLARYLKEFVGLRSTTIYDVNKYESVLWFGDMPQEAECQSPAWRDEFAAGDPWLVVHKRNYSPRERRSRTGGLGGGLCQGVADGGESAPAVAAAGFDN